MSEAWLRERVATALTGVLGDGVPDAETVNRALAPSKKAGQGDYAFPCFVLAKELRQAPPAIAADVLAALQTRIDEAPELLKAEQAGPYVNVYVDPTARARVTLGAIAEAGAAYGTSDAGQGRAVCVDFSSPNIAKPFGIGHLRSTVIGSAICNLYRACGWNPVGINHLGDWGKQFGMLMVALTERGGEERLDATDAPMAELYKLYVEIHADDDPTIEATAKGWFRRLEQGDAEARRLWQRCVDVSLVEFSAMYERLGVTDNLTHWWGESHYEGEPMDRVLAEAREREVLAESDGAQVVFLDDVDETLPPCLLVKADGATLYATRDLASAIYRQEETDAARLVYVVGAGQRVHFQQIFGVLGKLGYGWSEACSHVPFGLILGMSTRKGTMVMLDDVLAQAVSKVREVIEDRDYPDADKDVIAEQVGVGAIIFADLSSQRVKDWEFDWEQLLNFHGRTGPYLQYAYVRMGSVLDKFEAVFGGKPAADEAQWSALTDPEAQDLLRRLGTFPEVVARACEEHEPSVVSRYLLDLAESNNRFYSQRRVVDEADPGTSAARAVLTDGVRTVLASGLSLLGVALPDRM